MSKKAKIWMMVAVALILVGGAAFGGIMTVNDWNFETLSTDAFVTNTYDIQEAFKNISVEAISADVTLVTTDGGKVAVTCHELEKCRHSVAVENGTLTIRAQDQRKWYDHIGINFANPKITVEIPAGEYGEITVKTNTGEVKLPAAIKAESAEVTVGTGDVYVAGDVKHFVRVNGGTGSITVENAVMKVLYLYASTGKISLSSIQCEERITAELTTGDMRMSDIQCYSLVAKGGTGDMRFTDIRSSCLKASGTTGDAVLKNVIALEEFAVTRTTGDVKLEKCDGRSSFHIATETGDVTGTLLTRKAFYVKTDTGKVDVPLGGVTNGNCSITTTTGDIKIEIVE